MFYPRGTYRLRIRLTAATVLFTLCCSMTILCDSLIRDDDHGAAPAPAAAATQQHAHPAEGTGSCGHDGGCAIPCWYCGCVNTIVMVITPAIDLAPLAPSADYFPRQYPSPASITAPPRTQPPKT